MRPKGAVLAAWMANVEAEPEWEYHLQTELERGIARTEWLASGEALYVPCSRCAGDSVRAVPCAGWAEQVCVDGCSSFFPVPEMRCR